MKPQGLEVEVLIDETKRKKGEDAANMQPNVLTLEFEGWFQVKYLFLAGNQK
jgi:hypothetical protein